jgi:2-polyprenyl-3-methyl-5-hydroxy-6-metoxy-1,4-benzoquinol methylase
MYGLDGKTMLLLQESAELMEKWSTIGCASKNKGGMEEWAKDEGAHKEHNEFSCDWYHGTWQYMRLLNMVAVPDWYHFYNEALNEILQKKPNANVFISACADYGMLAKLHESIKAVKANPVITIYDICETPLKSCEWYAKKYGLEISCKTANIITDEIPEAPFDLITTDEFLSVLKNEYKPLIVEKWKSILKPGGKIVTTAMIGKPTEISNRSYYYDKANYLFKMYGRMLFPEHYTNGNAGTLMKRFKAFADYHTRHMLIDEHELIELFKDFSSFSYESNSYSRRMCESDRFFSDCCWLTIDCIVYVIKSLITR